MPNLGGKSLTMAILAYIFVAALVSCDNKPSAGYVFKSPCGTREEVVSRFSDCANPLIEVLQGKTPPLKTDAEIRVSCERYNVTEKCLRTMGKNCLSGLHKTVIGTIAGATRRLRLSDCKDEASRAKLIGSSECIYKNSRNIFDIYQNSTAMMQGIREMVGVSPEAKLLKICCVTQHLDKALEKSFFAMCPKDAASVLRQLRELPQDAKNTLCVNPKCQGVMESVRNHKYKPPQTFIDTLFEAVLDLNFE